MKYNNICKSILHSVLEGSKSVLFTLKHPQHQTILQYIFAKSD